MNSVHVHIGSQGVLLLWGLFWLWLSVSFIVHGIYDVTKFVNFFLGIPIEMNLSGIRKIMDIVNQINEHAGTQQIKYVDIGGG